MEASFPATIGSKRSSLLVSSTSLATTNSAFLLQSNGESAPSAKRHRPPPPPVVMLPGQTAFRLLCPSALVGGVIGKSGSVIQLFRQETGALIRVEEAVPGCDERVILVVAATKKKENNAAEGEREVSVAQDALVRVFDRVLKVEDEKPAAGGTGSTVTCRLLASTGQVGGVMGKGGKVVARIRKETGAKIRVLPLEQLPACASPSDELIQIVGDASAVRKALIAVSRCLQNNPPLDKLQSMANRPVRSLPHGSFGNVRGEPSSRRNSLPMTGASASGPSSGGAVDHLPGGHSLRLDGADGISSSGQRMAQQEVAFRLVCSDNMVGGVIGKGGAIVKALENETGASISVAPRVSDSEDRVITVSAMEYPESQLSRAQNAVIRVHARSVEAGLEKGLVQGSEKGDSVSAKVLVQADQIGCLLGKGGTIVAEMRKATGASIWIFRQDQVPKCASKNDELVQITGTIQSVREALCMVTSRLRDNMFPNRPGSGSASLPSAVPAVGSYGVAHEATTTGPYSSHNFEKPSSLTLSIDSLTLPITDKAGLSDSFNHLSSTKLWEPQALTTGNQRGIPDIGQVLSTVRSGTDTASASKSAVITNTTVEISVPERVFGAVYGTNGSNLNIIRQISGAKVIAHDPLPGAAAGTVIISGTPEQTQSAQNLLQAFILSGPGTA
ncbi:KH domain-containing protein [Nymphaea thermarum]|nr:KH domain-containing protein [Nymphaea thermarum]